MHDSQFQHVKPLTDSLTGSPSRFPRQREGMPWWVSVGLSVLLIGLLSLQSGISLAQESAPKPVGRSITLGGSLGDPELGLVRRTALELQALSVQENREAFLILNLQGGISEFHNIFALAEFLTGGSISRVRTIAWIDEAVTGNQVLIAMACNEIVLTDKGSLGDMGLGKAVAAERQNIVQSIVAKRRNPRMTAPLATAMMDPATSLINVTLMQEEGGRETKLMTAAEVQRHLDAGGTVVEQRTVKEPGTPGIILGRDAQLRQLLSARTPKNRRELAESLGIPPDELRELSSSSATSQVAFIQLHHTIDYVFQSFALNQIARAIKQGAETIIFEIDTPGGMLDVCLDLSSKIIRLNESGIRTIAYIPNEAVSGGAIIASACSEIYMKPDARIGDAIPINLTGGGGFVHSDPKILSVLLEHMRMLARKTDRPAAILEGFCDAKLEVFEVTHKQTGRKWFMSQDEIHQSGEEWQKGPRVPESRPEVAVFISGERAHELKIAAPPVQGLEELKERLGLPVSMEFEIAERLWVDDLIFYLNNEWVTGMLFFLAVVCIYVELATMTGFFGILAACAFGVFFWSRMLGGTAGTLELSMFLLGIGCLAIEIFVIPGFGVFGVSGILLVIGSLLMASMTFSGLGMRYDLGSLLTAMGPFAASMVAVIIFASMISKYLPHIPILNNIILAPPNANPTPGEPQLARQSAAQRSELIGESGKAVTVLRPAGKALVNGELYDVVSDGPFIPDGSEIQVVEVQGNRIVVRQEETV